MFDLQRHMDHQCSYGNQLIVIINFSHEFPRFKWVKMLSIMQCTLKPRVPSIFPLVLIIYLECVDNNGLEKSEFQ